MTALPHGELEAVYRAEFGAVVASLTARFRDLDLAEEMAQEAFVEAVRRWPTEGVPPNPGGWLTVVARNRALDRLRRESTRQSRYEEALVRTAPEDPTAPVTSVVDERLRLIFTCCHPALAPEARVALTLRLLGGLTVPEVAAAFLVPERTMAQRITRAKRKIAAANIPYRVPRDHELPDRLAGVLAVLYLVFTEGHLPAGGGDGIRDDLCAEAIRLARVLRSLMPDEPEVAGLLALMLLTDARRAARLDAGGALVTLDAQDRSLWDREKIAEGHALVRECLRRNRPGHYQLLAAVNAVHTDATTASETDWGQVLALYDQLMARHADGGRGAEPRGGRCRGRGPGCRAAGRRRLAAGGLPPLPCHAGRPAAQAGTSLGCRGRLPARAGTRDEPGRARVPRAALRRGQLTLVDRASTSARVAKPSTPR